MMKNYHPNNMEELCRDLGQLTPESKIISGGTDLIIRLHSGAVKPDALLYMGGVKECRTVEEKEDYIEIGAACTMTQLEKCPLLRPELGAIPDATGDVGSPQIRNNGTIGGNIANASPAGDTLPVLWMLEAQVVIASPAGLRAAPIHEVVLGPGCTSLGHQEAIVAFRVKKGAGRTAFVKLGFRGKVTISRIGLAVRLDQDDQGVVRSARIIAGAISLTPVEVTAAEEALVGKDLTHETVAAAGKALSDLIMKITPEKFDRDYKVWAAKGVMEDVLAKFH